MNLKIVTINARGGILDNTHPASRKLGPKISPLLTYLSSLNVDIAVVCETRMTEDGPHLQDDPVRGETIMDLSDNACALEKLFNNGFECDGWKLVSANRLCIVYKDDSKLGPICPFSDGIPRRHQAAGASCAMSVHWNGSAGLINLVGLYGTPYDVKEGDREVWEAAREWLDEAEGVSVLAGDLNQSLDIQQLAERNIDCWAVKAAREDLSPADGYTFVTAADQEDVVHQENGQELGLGGQRVSRLDYFWLSENTARNLLNFEPILDHGGLHVLNTDHVPLLLNIQMDVREEPMGIRTIRGPKTEEEAELKRLPEALTATDELLDREWAMMDARTRATSLAVALQRAAVDCLGFKRYRVKVHRKVHPVLVQLDKLKVNLGPEYLARLLALKQEQSEDVQSSLDRVLSRDETGRNLCEHLSHLRVTHGRRSRAVREKRQQLRRLITDVRKRTLALLRQEEVMSFTSKRDGDYDQGRHGNRRFFSRFKPRSTFHTLKVPSANGSRTITKNQELVDVIADFHEEKFSLGEGGDEEGDEEGMEGEGALNICDEADEEDLERAMKLPPGKVLGDFATRAFFGCFPHGLKLKLLDVFNHALKGECLLPDQWRKGWLTVLPKRMENGIVARPKDLRPIGLLSGFYKVFERVLAPRLAALVDNLDNSQGAFRKHSSTLSQISSLQYHIAEQRRLWQTRGGDEGETEEDRAYDREYSRPVLLSCDVAGAFDRLHRRKALLTTGLNKASRDLLLNMTNISFDVRREGCASRSFVMERGVVQGGVLSPLLFVLAFQRVLDELRDEKAVGFADDVSVVCHAGQVSTILDRINTVLASLGLELNASKTTVFPLVQGHGPRMNIVWNGEALKVVDHVNVLGFPLSHSMEPAKELMSSKSWHKSFGLLTLKQRATLHNMKTVPAMSYVLNATNLTEAGLREVERAAIRPHRRHLMLKESCTSAVRKLLGLSSVQERSVARCIGFLLSVANGRDNVHQEIPHLVRNDEQAIPTALKTAKAWLRDRNISLRCMKPPYDHHMATGNLRVLGAIPSVLDGASSVTVCPGWDSELNRVDVRHQHRVVYTDGSASDGVGGFGVVEAGRGLPAIMCGKLDHRSATTVSNNLCELTAVAFALWRYRHVNHLTIWTDSQYVVMVAKDDFEVKLNAPNAAVIMLIKSLLCNRKMRLHGEEMKITTIEWIKAHQVPIPTRQDGPVWYNHLADRAANWARVHSDSSFALGEQLHVPELDDCYALYQDIENNGTSLVTSAVNTMVHDAFWNQDMETWKSLHDDEKRIRQAWFPRRFKTTCGLKRAVMTVRNLASSAEHSRWARFPLSWTLSIIGGYSDVTVMDWEKYLLDKIKLHHAQGLWNHQSCEHGAHLRSNRMNLLLKKLTRAQATAPRVNCRTCEFLIKIATTQDWYAETQLLHGVDGVDGVITQDRLDWARIIELSGALSSGRRDTKAARHEAEQLLHDFILHIHQFWLQFRQEKWPEHVRHFDEPANHAWFE